MTGALTDVVSEPVGAATYDAGTARSERGAVIAVHDLGEVTFDAALVRMVGDRRSLLRFHDDSTLGKAQLSDDVQRQFRTRSCDGRRCGGRRRSGN